MEQVFNDSDLSKSGVLDHEECKLAVAVWSSMLQERDFIDSVFKK